MNMNFAHYPTAAASEVGNYEAETARLAATRSSARTVEDSGYNRAVRILLALGVFLLPLFYLPWTSGILEFNKLLLLVVLVSVSLIVWLLGIVVHGVFVFRRTVVDKAVLGLLAATFVASLFSVVPTKSIFGMPGSLSSSLLAVIALSLFYLLSVNVFQDRGHMLRTALAASFVVGMLFGVLQMLGWHILPGAFANSSGFNTVGTLNAFGVFAAVALPMLAKVSLRKRARWTAWLAMAGVALSIIVLGILNWWVLWVIALAGMLATIAFDSLNITHLAQEYGKKRQFALSRFIVPTIVIVIGAFLLLVNFNLNSVKEDFPVEIAPSFDFSWQVVRGVFGQNLLFGLGPENFSLGFDRFAAGELAASQFSNLRFSDGASELMSMAVHGGAIGLLALVVLFWALVQVLSRFSSALSESAANRNEASWAIESSGVLASLIALLVAFFLYPFPLTLAFILVVFLVLAALIVDGGAQQVIDIEERPLFSLGASLGFIVALILVLTGVYFTSVRYVADARYVHALQQSEPDAAIGGLARAIELNNTDDRYFRDASQVVLLVLRDELSNSQGGDDTGRMENLVSSAVQLAQRAVQLNPEEALNWFNLGQVYQSLGGLVEEVEQLAEDAYRKAGELRPGDPAYDNQIGVMWLGRAELIRSLATSANAEQLQGQYDEALSRAETAFQESIEKSPTFGLAIYNLGSVYERQGRVEEAIEQLEQIAPFNLNDAGLMFELGLLYIRNNDADSAITVLRRAVLLAPNYANARWYLALLLEDAGDFEGALTHLYAIRENNPDVELLLEKIDQLEAGEEAEPPVDVIENEPLQ